MRFWVGLTDHDWYRYLSSRPQLDDVNFWQPSARRRPVRLDPGAPFLFKLHASAGGRIVGGGFFATYTALPARIAWDYFGENNGAPTLGAMVERIARYRRKPVDAHADQIGCIGLVQPFFFSESDWMGAPRDWAPNIVQGRTYDSEVGEGRVIWEQLEMTRARGSFLTLTGASATPAIAETPARYGIPALVAPRLGQGTFRLAVAAAYERRCAITGERTLPALSAAHIKPYGLSGPHGVDNGLLLRTDVHTLFDRGYLTVTADLRVRVSGRIRDEFENGRDYYALDHREISVPTPPYPQPGRDYLEWHGDTVFRG